MSLMQLSILTVMDIRKIIHYYMDDPFKEHVVAVSFLFFFQAEYVSRDFCLSRRLGDVYKIQMQPLVTG